MQRLDVRLPRRSDSVSGPSLARTVSVLLLALLGGAVATPPTLYAAVYPEPGSNIVTREQLKDALNTALTDARVTWGTVPATDPVSVVAWEPTRFAVTVLFGKDLTDEPGPKVEVAWQNQAVLTAANPEAVQIAPQDPISKSLADARPAADGGFALEWDWTLTATLSGTTELRLLLQPLIFVDGRLEERLAERNEPILVPVEVHPAETAFRQAVQSATDDLQVDAPEQMTDGRAATISARLPRTWDPDGGVVAELELTRLDRSVPASIEPSEPTELDDGGLEQSWRVEPQDRGLLELRVDVQLSARAGARDPLTDSVPRALEIDVQATLWDRILEPVVYVTAFISLVAGMAGLWALRRRRRAPAPVGASPVDAPAATGAAKRPKQEKQAKQPRQSEQRQQRQQPPEEPGAQG